MKIGITCYPTYGGSGVVATELGLALASMGHEVHFISYAIPHRLTRFVNNVFFHEVETSTYPLFEHSLYDLSLTSKMLEVIEYEDLDLMHVHYAIPHAVSAYLAKQVWEKAGRKIKFITTLHGTDITVLGYDPSLTDAIRFGIEKSDYVTAVSNSLISQTHELIKPKKDIDCVYNFIDTRVNKRTDSSKLRKEYGILPHEKVVIHVSNFRPVKRVPDVIQAFAKIAEQLPAKLVLVGDGPEMKTVCNLAGELGIRDKVLLLGKQERVEELYSLSDLMLLLSEKESFGLVALEAMACGVPCIGTNVGGIPEVIVDGETGYICELGDIKDITEKAVEILSNEDIHRRYSANSMERAEKRFSSEQIVSEYENIYYQLVGQDER